MLGKFIKNNNICDKVYVADKLLAFLVKDAHKELDNRLMRFGFGVAARFMGQRREK